VATKYSGKNSWQHCYVRIGYGCINRSYCHGQEVERYYKSLQVFFLCVGRSTLDNIKPE
jgi:hypothetical protein